VNPGAPQQTIADGCTANPSSALNFSALPKAARTGAHMVVLSTQPSLPRIPSRCGARVHDSVNGVDLESLALVSRLCLRPLALAFERFLGNGVPTLNARSRICPAVSNNASRPYCPIICIPIVEGLREVGAEFVPIGTGMVTAGKPARLAGTVNTSSAKVSTEFLEATHSNVGGSDCEVGVIKKSIPVSVSLLVFLGGRSGWPRRKTLLKSCCTNLRTFCALMK